jgi:hypothetical protein
MLLRDLTPPPPYQVLWDGTNKTARQLAVENGRFVPEQPRREAPVLQTPPDRPRTERVYEALATRPDTLYGVSQRTGINLHDVNGAVFTLRRRGTVVIVGVQELDRSRQRYGRSREMVYGVKTQDVAS